MRAKVNVNGQVMEGFVRVNAAGRTELCVDTVDGVAVAGDGDYDGIVPLMGQESNMNINNLFRIADAAKNLRQYEIANAAFAVLAMEAISVQYFHAYTGVEGADEVEFLYEYDNHDDLVGALADPDGAGYYDLPALSYYGPRLMGGYPEEHYLCIPLPLVSREFTNYMIRLMRKDSSWDQVWTPRLQHSRKTWRMTYERQQAARRDLWRRLLEEVGEYKLAVAKAAFLYSEPEPQAEPEPEPQAESESVWTTYNHVVYMDKDDTGYVWLMYGDNIVYQSEYTVPDYVANNVRWAVRQFVPEWEDVRVDGYEPVFPGELDWWHGSVSVLA